MHLIVVHISFSINVSIQLMLTLVTEIPKRTSILHPPPPAQVSFFESSIMEKDVTGEATQPFGIAKENLGNEIKSHSTKDELRLRCHKKTNKQGIAQFHIRNLI